LRIFVITGASVGVIGTVIGFIAGTLVCIYIDSIHRFLIWLLHVDVFNSEIYFLSKLPAEMSFGETTSVVVLALALSLLATLYPAWRAARLDPVEALRYE
jgi:lipoprotein-releasing system permease protein